MTREELPREFDPVIELYKKDVDRTLIRENLKLTHSQRVEKLIELQRFAGGLKKAGDELRKRKRRERQDGQRSAMKYVARVREVLRPGIHKIATIQDGRLVPVADLPLPDRVEIHCKDGPDRPCETYRYTDAGEFCGDTWAENLQDAFEQARYEYGLSEADFGVEE